MTTAEMFARYLGALGAAVRRSAVVDPEPVDPGDVDARSGDQFVSTPAIAAPFDSASYNGSPRWPFDSEGLAL